MIAVSDAAVFVSSLQNRRFDVARVKMKRPCSSSLNVPDKKTAGIALAASTNHIKSLASLLPEEAAEQRAKLKEKIPTIAGG